MEISYLSCLKKRINYQQTVAIIVYLITDLTLPAKSLLEYVNT